jgi:hypothetical protein
MMSEENKTAEAAVTGPKRKYKEWEHRSPDDVAMSRKIFIVMMATMAILLVVLAYGALR